MIRDSIGVHPVYPPPVCKVRTSRGALSTASGSGVRAKALVVLVPAPQFEKLSSRSIHVGLGGSLVSSRSQNRVRKIQMSIVFRSIRTVWSVATPKEWPRCQVLYSPFLQKHLVPLTIPLYAFSEVPR